MTTNKLIEMSLEEFDIPFTFYMSLRRYSKLHERLRSKLGKTMGLTDAQYYLLRVLAFKGNLSYTKLAESTGLSHNTVSTLIRTLIKSGYVKQIPCEDDGRITFLCLDKKGLEMMGKVYKCDLEIAELIKTVAARIEMDQLIQKLDEIHQIGKCILSESITVE